MKPTNIMSHYTDGALPIHAPLANPYVPFQRSAIPAYDAQKGIVRGTLYPGLDLPFKGMFNRKNLPVTPLTELQALDFAIQELALYLDTHRDDKEALVLYRQYQARYLERQRDYALKHGPLYHTHQTEADKYEWLEDPWPWEYSKNKEV